LAYSSILGLNHGRFWVEEATVSVEPGSKLIIYTDGLTEARNIQGKSYARGFSRFIRSHVSRTASPSDLVNAIRSDLASHAQQIKSKDDICFAVIALEQHLEQRIAS
jgi:serine phosphatase RsbU (regulator of sigma subunit)